ncbi:MAG: hypothetical protein V7K92_11470, partial [Nostoc sp.]|uniref:hypothetical protein n=1 Tax=Nostoc sp. TaxID=1180 RepID=UPI002FEFAE3C
MIHAIEPPTLFEQDINNLVERLKAEVRYIYRQYQLSPYVEWWIYGNNEQNQEMLLFKQFADPIVSKYSQNRTQTEPKNLYAVYEYLAEQANNNYSQSNQGYFILKSCLSVSKPKEQSRWACAIFL